MAIEVLLYEDNTALSQSITALLNLNTNFKVVKALPNAQTVLEDIFTYKPAVVLMDINMPGKTGIEAVAEVRTKFEDLPVIMLTVFEDTESIYNAICNGASGYLLKKNFEEIPHAIMDVLNGGAPITSSIAKKVLSLLPKKEVETKKHTVELENLSNRESEILELVAKGNSYKMVAAALNISIETVRSHIKKIYKKLHVNSATEAAYKYNKGK